MRSESWIRQNRVYLLMLMLIAFFYLFFKADRGAVMEAGRVAYSENAMLYLVAAGLTLFFAGLGIFIYLVARRIASGDTFPRVTLNARPRWNFWDALKLSIAILCLVYVFSAVLAVFWKLLSPFFQADQTALLAAQISLQNIIGLAVCIYTVKKIFRQPLSSLGLAPSGALKAVGSGVVAYIAFFPLLALAAFLVVSLFQAADRPAQPQMIFEYLLNSPIDFSLVYIFFFIGIVVPVVEELLFRGFLYGGARSSWGVLSAILISAGIFAALHANIGALLPIFLLGILLGYIYEKTGSLVAPITVHMLHNLLILGAVMIIRSFPA